MTGPAQAFDNRDLQHAVTSESDIESSKPGPGTMWYRVGLIVAFGWALSIAAFAIARAIEDQRLARELEVGASDRVAAVQRALDSQRLKLEALAAFVTSLGEIDLKRFRSFATPLLRQGHPLQGISWAPLVTDQQRSAMEATARAEGVTGFRITERDQAGLLVPAATRATYTPVLYIQPVAGNEAALGFDLSSEPNRRVALEATRDTGEMYTTRRLNLVQEARPRVGFLSAIAVFRPGDTLATTAERRDSLIGFATQVFWIDDLIERGLANLQPGGIDLYFYDPVEGENAQPIYIHASRKRAPQDAPRLSPVHHHDSLSHLGRLRVGGREWRVLSLPTAGFLADKKGPLPWVLLGMGLVATMLGAGFAAGAERRTRKLRVAHAELKRSEARVRNLVEQMPALLVAFDDSNVVVAWNKECERVTGYTAAEIVGNPKAAEVLYPDPDHLEDLRAEAEANQQTYRDWEVTLTAKDGTPRVVAWSNLSATMPIPGWASWEIGVDVTERQRVARERQEMQEQLLEGQKLESLGLLAGGIAHDFNNLLTAILGNASLARELVPVATRAGSALEGVVQASQRASLLTQQLLAYTGKGSFETRPIDLSEHVREIGSLLGAAIPKRISLRFDLCPNLPAIMADPSRIQQLVMNLVLNGAEASGDQPGTVFVRTGVREIDENNAKSLQALGEIELGTYVYLEVQDDGQGMDAATQKRVFDPFFSTKFSGRGLGLAAAVGIVRSHSGSIKVYSSPGEGSVFKVFLPICEEAPDRRPPEPSGELKGSGLILVVDDEPMICQLADRTLSGLGYQVVTARDGLEAVDVFRERGAEIDCVLLDMTMPKLDGEATLEKFRELRSDVIVILSSGYNEVAATQRFVGKGLAGFLQKPYSARQLAEKVKVALDARSST